MGMAVGMPCQDVMQVCRNGHVVTDLLRAYPDQGLSHCDRCGAPTLDHCQTCGHELPGAVHVPGLVPVGSLEPPLHCSHCGAAFPWAASAPAPASEAWPVLENLLRRLPQVARQLRVRHGDRPAFRIADERDLEDLMRALLPLHFDQVRPRCRTPGYSPATITDFLLEPANTVITVKRAAPGERELTRQLDEDAAYYARELSPGTLVCLVYDPEMTLHEPPRLEAVWSRSDEDLSLRCVIAS